MTRIRNLDEEPRVIQDELELCLDVWLEDELHNVYLLYAEQMGIFEAVMECIDNHKVCTRVFFIDGPGDTGKTFLYNILLGNRSMGKINLAMASSGIAALFLDGGRIVHS
ncbi:hypothetical protein LOD99_7150 [Oopsacas minuta]|uniref:ATP-dependent DNA helicase n=1 Tax=Oopsacas minuta TaxID=111878 RepID=A0AAV7JIN5_9METZ|nr:hypothetical protein LOD99_7150 [Oopsacas minuta]